MICQTIRAMVTNYQADGHLASKVALHPDGSLAQNSKAFKWLVDNRYLEVDGDYCRITQLAIAKLFVYFEDTLYQYQQALTEGGN